MQLLSHTAQSMATSPGSPHELVQSHEGLFFEKVGPPSLANVSYLHLSPISIDRHMSASAALVASLVCGVRVAPTAKRLILVRHGAVNLEKSDPKIKPGGFYGGNVDVPLSAIGEAEALAAAKQIAAEYSGEVNGIWASPMRRALFGARAVGTALAVKQSEGAEWTPPMEIVTHDAFREVDRGPIGEGWTNLTPDEIEARDGPNAMEKFAMEEVPGAFKAINGGEGFCDLRERVLKQRDEVLKALPLGGTGVIVSHLWVTRSMVGESMGEPNPLKVDIPTASISVVDYPDGAKPIVVCAGVKPVLEE